MANFPVRSLSVHQTAASAILMGCVLLAACQRQTGPADSGDPPLEEHASSILVVGSLRSALGTPIAGAPIRVESRPVGCGLPVDSWQLAVTGADGSFAVQAYGRLNAPSTGCIVGRDTLSSSSQELRSDSVRFKLSAPFDTVKLQLIRN